MPLSGEINQCTAVRWPPHTAVGTGERVSCTGWAQPVQGVREGCGGRRWEVFWNGESWQQMRLWAGWWEEGGGSGTWYFCLIQDAFLGSPCQSWAAQLYATEISCADPSRPIGASAVLSKKTDRNICLFQCKIGFHCRFLQFTSSVVGCFMSKRFSSQNWGVWLAFENWEV